MIQVIQQKHDSTGTHVHLKFMHNPQIPLHTEYDAILLNAKSSQLSFIGEEQICDEGEDEVRHIPASDYRKGNLEP